MTAPYFELYGIDSLFAASGGQFCDFEKMDASGIHTLGVAVCNGSRSYFQIGHGDFEVAGPVEWARERTLRDFAARMTELRSVPRLHVVEGAADLAFDRPAGELAILPLITGHCYMTDLDVLDTLYAMGLRISHCAHNFCCTWNRGHGASRVEGRIAPVMTDFGRSVVTKMNELGIIIDVAHLSDESTEEILRTSTKPIIDGHTGSKDFNPCCRGHHDWVLRRIAESGGVVGIHFADHIFSRHVHGSKYPLPKIERGPEPRLFAYNRHLLATVSEPDERCRLRKDRVAKETFYQEHGLVETPVDIQRDETMRVPVADMADHVEYLVNRIGIDHVGIGGDVNGIAADQWPGDMEHVGELPHLTAELLRRGWDDDSVGKFLTHNWQRAFSDCL